MSHSAIEQPAATTTPRRADPKRRGCLLRRHHEIRYAVIITDRAPMTNEPEVVHCLFCMHFGREVLSSVVRTRKPMKKVKTFKAPFRVDHFTQHHKIHHLERWEYYCSVTDDEKKVYFSSDPFASDEVMIDLPLERLERTRGPYKVAPKFSSSKAASDPAKDARITTPATAKLDESAVQYPQQSIPGRFDKAEVEQIFMYTQQRQQADLEIARKNLELKQIEVISSSMMARQKMLDAGISQEHVDRLIPFPDGMGTQSVSL
ncbi:hypothetical protein DYB37_004850 [Aphanomyces astaci]|uniref:Uncharacterized protein n=1 Tax=Aphanomyces astaci TaxID=112090 RepID=A0A3R6XPT6_APHAT|nr:hypothetical protein DYB35_003795 [Aphanomyces astaci]RHZ19176.1 hypothetical protein DYB37_004850 [Aphanomyces astaci]